MLSKFKLLCDIIILFQNSKDTKDEFGHYSCVRYIHYKSVSHKILIMIWIHPSVTDQRMYSRAVVFLIDTTAKRVF